VLWQPRRRPPLPDKLLCLSCLLVLALVARINSCSNKLPRRVGLFDVQAQAPWRCKYLGLSVFRLPLWL